MQVSIALLDMSSQKCYSVPEDVWATSSTQGNRAGFGGGREIAGDRGSRRTCSGSSRNLAGRRTSPPMNN